MISTVANKCHAKIVIFFYHFSDFLSSFSDFFSDFFSGLKLHIVEDCFFFKFVHVVEAGKAKSRS